MACKGAAATADLSDTPENVCKQYVPSIQNCLDWHASTWEPLESEFAKLGFGWAAYLQSTEPEVGANAELNRIRKAVTGDLGTILGSRRGWLRFQADHGSTGQMDRVDTYQQTYGRIGDPAPSIRSARFIRRRLPSGPWRAGAAG